MRSEASAAQRYRAAPSRTTAASESASHQPDEEGEAAARGRGERAGRRGEGVGDDQASVVDHARAAPRTSPARTKRLTAVTQSAEA